MTTMHEPSAIDQGGALRGRALLVALTGGAEAAAAARVAATLVNARECEVVVIRAYTPEPAILPYLRTSAWAPSPVQEIVMTARLDLERATNGTSRWPVLVSPGAPGQLIATTARDLDAALILMGLHPRGAVQRAFGLETALRVLRHTDRPVLATTATLQSIPKRILVGVDFGRAGLRAARAALALLADDGTLDLAFVDRPPYPLSDEGEGDDIIHRQGVAAAFDRLRAELAAPANVTVTTSVLDGVPSVALRELAERTGAEVIAVGSRRHGLIDRMLLGSVTEDLMHDGRWSLLVVPCRPNDVRWQGRPRPMA